MASLLQKAIDLAFKFHRGEDPPAEPYIVHPMRVMLSLSQADDAHQNELLRCVAILHDTIERAGATAKDLKKGGMPKEVIAAVELLTHADDVSYADYVIKLKPNALARAVKIADLMDNSDLRRITFRPGKKRDLKRGARYAASYKFLTNQMSEKDYRDVMERCE